MNIPDYVRTNWKSKSSCLLKFSSSTCANCVINAEEETRFTLKDANKCDHSKEVKFTTSIFSVWEYEGNEIDNSENLKEESKNEKIELNFKEDHARPPSLSKEIWQMWEVHWNDWKDIYINLSWVKRFPSYSDVEDIQWYDIYCRDFSHIVKYVSFCDDVELLSENSLRSTAGLNPAERDEIVSRVSSEFAEKRYWVHLRLFLRDLEVEIDQELKSFFVSHGITSEPDSNVVPGKNYCPEVNEDDIIVESLKKEISKESLDKALECDTIADQFDNSNTEKCNKELTSNTIENSARKTPVIDNLRHSLETYFVSNNDKSNVLEMPDGGTSSEELLQNTGDENILNADGDAAAIISSHEEIVSGNNTEQLAEIKFEENIIDECPQKINNELSDINKQNLETDSLLKDNGDVTNLSGSTRQLDDSMDTGLLLNDDQFSSASYLDDLNDASNYNVITDNIISKDKILSGKGREVSNKKMKKLSTSGIAWALKRAQTIEFENGKLNPESDDVRLQYDPFIDCPPSTVRRRTNDYEGSITDIPIQSVHNNFSVDVSLQPACNGVHNIPNTVNNGFLYLLDIVLIVIRSLLFILEALFQGITTFVVESLTGQSSGYHSGRQYPFFNFKRNRNNNESAIEAKFSCLQKKNSKCLKEMLGLSAKLINLDACNCNNKLLYLTEVVKSEYFSQESDECLIKVSHCNANECLDILYMTEDDIDSALVELDPDYTSHCEPTSYRTKTIFDEEGHPSDVIKIPANEEAKGSSHSKSELKCESLYSTEVQFDLHGNPVCVPVQSPQHSMSRHSKIGRILRNCRLMTLSKELKLDGLDDLPVETVKYWLQRYRLFFRYDENIMLDKESWYSVTPEAVAGHHAHRLACDIVIDAFCGAGGNAIQLAATCNRVIAIDIDPAKISLARNNAQVYGVEDRIEFIQGDFFKLAPRLKADCVLLSPPWGGVNYLQGNAYDIFNLGGIIEGHSLYKTVSKITKNIALYLPKNSNILQIVELALFLDAFDPKVDLEFNFIANKLKSLTAYFGNLADFSTN